MQTPAHFEGKKPLRKESCTGPYANIALILISSYRIIALNRVDEIVPYARGRESVVDERMDVVHVVLMECSSVGLPKILGVHLRVDNTLDPLHHPRVIHVALLLIARDRLLTLCLVVVGRRIDPLYRCHHDSLVSGSKVRSGLVSYV